MVKNVKNIWSLVSKQSLLFLLKDIRFWIFLFAVIRLYGITNPPLEVAHSWRQTTVTMVARNFYEVDPNILYPRIDIAEDMTGITGMEFPLLNYLVFLVSKLFGYNHWYGRLINLIVSSLGCWYFYRLLRKYFSERVAFASAFLLTVSLWFSYSRKIMPDTFSMSLIIMGVYYGTNYLESASHRFLHLLLYVLMTLMGLLSKLPSGYILVVFLLPMLDRKIQIQRKVVFVLFSVLLCVPVVWWYWYWVPYLVKEYGFWHFFMGKNMAVGARELLENWNDTLAHFYDEALKFIGFGIFLMGLIYCFIRKEKLILSILGLGFMAFFVVMLKSGFTFAHHTYYVLPFVPVMALVAGYGVVVVNKAGLRVLLLTAVVLENVLNQKQDFTIHENRESVVRLEEILDGFSQPSDLIVINSGEEPTPMYFAHRKGWVAYNEQLSDASFIDDIRQRGCQYVVVLKRAFGSCMTMDLAVVFDSDDYTIYSLNRKD